MVGQHRLYQNGRLYGRAIQDDCRRRNLWSVQLVKHCFMRYILFVLQRNAVSSASQRFRDGCQWYGDGDIELSCGISMRFSAVWLGSVLRTMYVCVNTSHWVLYIFLSFSLGDRSWAGVPGTCNTRHWDVRLLKLSQGLVRQKKSCTHCFIPCFALRPTSTLNTHRARHRHSRANPSSP